MSEKCK